MLSEWPNFVFSNIPETYSAHCCVVYINYNNDYTGGPQFTKSLTYSVS